MGDGEKAKTDPKEAGDGAAAEGEESAAEARYDFEPLGTTMSQEEWQNVQDITQEAFKDSNTHKDIATKIKKSFETKFPQTSWYCIVGEHFAASVTHQTKEQAFFKVVVHKPESISHMNVLLFRSLD